MNELERALLELEVEWPATPDLAATVRAEIERPAPRRRRSWRRRAAIALASVLVLGGGTLAVSPSARSTVSRWLGLDGVEIRHERPTATPGPRSRLGESLNLGAPIAPARARAAGALFPRSLPAPDAAYLGFDAGGQRPVALVWAPRAGLPPSKVTGVALLVQTFRAQVDPVILKKMGENTEYLTVGGAPAYWLSGEPHGFQIVTPSGGGFFPQRLADHTLLVQRGDKLLRIEGALTRDEAVAIAESVQ
jgi:hypothetical protein